MMETIFALCIMVTAVPAHSIFTTLSQTYDKIAQPQHTTVEKNKWTKNIIPLYRRLEIPFKINDNDFTQTMDFMPKAKFVRSTKRILKDKDVVLGALKQNDQDIKITLDKLKQKDLASIAATDLFHIIMATQRHVRCAKHEENKIDHISKEINKSKTFKTHTIKPETVNLKDLNSTPARHLTQMPIRSKSENIGHINKEMNKSAIDRPKNIIKTETLSSKNLKSKIVQNQKQIPIKSRSVRSTKLKESIINKRIDDNINQRDIVHEALSKLIQNEKKRQRFDLVNPPNTKYSKRQQLLWDRLRIKAAEELLIHRNSPQRVTERIFDTLKMDLELASTEPIRETRLFDELKNKVEKEYYLDLMERGKGRVYVSTLKPYYY